MVIWSFMKPVKLLVLLCLFSSIAFAVENSSKNFEAYKNKAWTEVFNDPCNESWQEKWFLDGEKAKVTNSKEHMAIDTAKGYAVLWTKKSFEGDLRIEYDFLNVDSHNKGVNIIYIQATGDAQKGHDEDITKWSDRRTSAAMSDYFLNMHTYHVSYAAFGNKPNVDYKDYVRARRYLPEANKGMKNTKMKGEYADTGLFVDKKWVHVTIIKKAKEFWVEFKHPDKTLLCHFVNTKNPPVEKGRIGLRLMPKRLSHFKNFKVMQLKSGK
jgi:hypothetical protein